jgi:hypothetical protein
VESVQENSTDNSSNAMAQFVSSREDFNELGLCVIALCDGAPWIAKD